MHSHWRIGTVAVILLLTANIAAAAFIPAAMYQQKAPAVVFIVNEYRHGKTPQLPPTISAERETDIPEPAVASALLAAYGLDALAGKVLHPVYHTARLDPHTNLVTHKSSGTGFFIRSDGLIVTNHHVINEHGMLTVSLFDGTQLSAQFLAADENRDIALLKVQPAKPVPTIAFSPSDDAIIIGSPALAIGHPYGDRYTQTFGSISWTAGYTPPRGTRQIFSLKAQVPVLPGNSGGPLIGEDGNAVGIIFARWSSTAAYGFAIPAGIAKRTINSLLARVP